ncbi:MAG: hypothetical protein AAFX40_12830 [Cyanobacteria bacterium J06639_1]
MARSVNPACQLCWRLSTEEARSLHGPQGDNCWQDSHCHNRRSYYRNRTARVRSQKRHRMERLGKESPELFLELPTTTLAVMTLYGDRVGRSAAGEVNERWRIPHAISAQLWHDQELIAKIEPMHCFGLSRRQIQQMNARILNLFSERLGQPVTGFQELIERPKLDCPIRPCPLHEDEFDAVKAGRVE